MFSKQFVENQLNDIWLEATVDRFALNQDRKAIDSLCREQIAGNSYIQRRRISICNLPWRKQELVEWIGTSWIIKRTEVNGFHGKYLINKNAR